jgi:hypothetical protein
MNKYYVQSGNIKAVITEETPFQAACEVMLNFFTDRHTPSFTVEVNEKGFDSHPQWSYDLLMVLEHAGFEFDEDE